MWYYYCTKNRHVRFNFVLINKVESYLCLKKTVRWIEMGFPAFDSGKHLERLWLLGILDSYSIALVHWKIHFHKTIISACWRKNQNFGLNEFNFTTRGFSRSLISNMTVKILRVHLEVGIANIYDIFRSFPGMIENKSIIGARNFSAQAADAPGTLANIIKGSCIQIISESIRHSFQGFLWDADSDEYVTANPPLSTWCSGHPGYQHPLRIRLGLIQKAINASLGSFS